MKTKLFEASVPDWPLAECLNAHEHAVLNNVRMQMHSLLNPYPEVKVFINGINQPNSGKGAYGIVMQYPDLTVEYSDYEWDATHNLMELIAALEALRNLYTPHEIAVYSSSEWFIKCARGEYYRASYPDLWAELDDAANPHMVGWYWIKSRDSPHIQHAHELARQAEPSSSLPDSSLHFPDVPLVQSLSLRTSPIKP